MKIKKTYQGSVPLNRISNQKDSSELNTYSTQYLNNKLVYIGLEQPTDGEEVWIQKGKNLLYTSYNENNKLSITATKDDYYIHTDYNCYLEKGKTYAVSFESDGEGGGQAGTDTVQIWLLKDNKYTYKYSFSSKAMTFIPEASGYYYLRFDVNKNATTHSFWNIQVEQGTTATSYEPHVDKRIFIKNDSGDYEEFYRENKRVVLWENKAPESAFEPQSILLNSDDYDYLEFAFCPNTGNSEAYWFKVKKGDNITAQLITGGTSAVYIRNRICDYVSDTEYSLRDSRTFSALNANSSEVDNSRVIPICVIGYKY